jgi:hypothetical protein
MARDQGERWRLHPMGRLTRAQMYPGAGGGLSLLPSFHLICKRRKRNTEGSEKCSRLNIQLRVAQLPSFRPSRGFQWRLVVELKNTTTTTHAHTHTHTSISIRRRGVEARNSGWVLWLSFRQVHRTCTEGHRRARRGWTAGWLQNRNKAAICIDCDQRGCTSTARKGQQQQKQRRRDDDSTSRRQQRRILHCLRREMV